MGLDETQSGVGVAERRVRIEHWGSPAVTGWNEEEPTQETGRGVRRGRADSQAGVGPEPRGKVLSEGKS